MKEVEFDRREKKEVRFGFCIKKPGSEFGNLGRVALCHACVKYGLVSREGVGNISHSH